MYAVMHLPGKVGLQKWMICQMDDLWYMSVFTYNNVNIIQIWTIYVCNSVFTYIELKSGWNHPNLDDLYIPILD